MPSDYTENYQLNQWEKADKVLMEDFNADNRKIEDALAGLEADKAKQSALTALSNTVTQLSSKLTAAQGSMLKIAAGVYDGNSTANRFISVGFTPKAVFVCDSYGATNYAQSNGRIAYRGGFAVPGGPVVTASYNGSYLKVVEVTTNGFYVTHGAIATNSSPIEAAANSLTLSYRYIAIG